MMKFLREVADTFVTLIYFICVLILAIVVLKTSKDQKEFEKITAEGGMDEFEGFF